jgi:hypothetical protein
MLAQASEQDGIALAVGMQAERHTGTGALGRSPGRAPFSRRARSASVYSRAELAMKATPVTRPGAIRVSTRATKPPIEKPISTKRSGASDQHALGHAFQRVVLIDVAVVDGAELRRGRAPRRATGRCRT